MGGTVTEPILQCVDIAVGFDAEKPILDNVNIEIVRGEIITLLGASGCGKSTLLRTLCGLLPPLHGEVRLFGASLYDLHEDRRSDLLRRIGFAFQADALFSSMTVEENVALPLRELTNLPSSVVGEMVRMRLELMGIGELAERHRSEISGGQRKRAALARASILDPELILCDEPTAGLDPVVAAEIDHTLVRFRDALGSTLVVVSHELASIRATADRAIMLAGGSIVATGSIDDLVQSHHKAVYEFFHARPE
jgi:phospholipid/cholesterol/gamma-HCH transport system ATP-binding protein